MKTPNGSGAAAGKGKKRSQPAVPLKVFIGYADLPAVRRAMATVADAARTWSRRVEIHPLLWRFEQLASDHWGSRAIKAAKSADVVVLTSSTPATLPASIEGWVNDFLASNRGRPVTLVAISGPTDAWTITVEEPLHAEMQLPARQGRAVAA